MKVAIFGASGFSREVADICLEIGYKGIIFVDYHPETETYFSWRVVDEDQIDQLRDNGYVFAIGIGDNRLRKKIYEKFSHLPYVNIIHPTASFGYHQKEKLAATQGNIITSGVRFTNNIEIGNFGIYNLNCTIGHDCIIKDFINLAPGANISGNVLLCDGVYIGTNATVLQGKSIDEKIKIGAFSTVGAGSVVTKEVSEGVIVKGIPAK